MSTPGWYADPDGSPRLRYFDGKQFTPHTTNFPAQPQGGTPQGSQWDRQGAQPPQPFQNQGNLAQQGQYQRPPGGKTSNGAGRGTVLLWVAVGVVAVLILLVGSWMVARDTSPTPAVTEPVTPVSSAPAEPPALQPGELPPAGTIIEPVTNCPATATDAVGEVNAEGRYASGANFSMPAAGGYVGLPVQYPWVHKSNSQAKQYDGGWMSSFTVGELSAEDGFTETSAAVVRVVGCMLGSERYASTDPTGTVIDNEKAPGMDGVKLFVDVTVPGASGVTTDRVYVLVLKDLGIMHVLIATVPDTDPLARDALTAINMDIRIDQE